MSFIRKEKPPPDIKEGEVLLAKVLDIQYPVTGKYKEQAQWRIQLDNGYETSVWMAFYEKPSERSVLGQLCITFMNMTQMPFNKVGDVLEAIKKHGKIYVKCSGFREWNEKLYPKFKVVSTKLPPLQPKVEPTKPSPAKEPTQPSVQPSSQQEALQLTPEALEAIRVNADIIAAGLPLNENDFTTFPAKVRLELLKRKLVERRNEFYWFTEAASSFLR